MKQKFLVLESEVSRVKNFTVYTHNIVKIARINEKEKHIWIFNSAKVSFENVNKQSHWEFIQTALNQNLCCHNLHQFIKSHSINQTNTQRKFNFCTRNFTFPKCYFTQKKIRNKNFFSFAIDWKFYVSKFYLWLKIKKFVQITKNPIKPSGYQLFLMHTREVSEAKMYAYMPDMKTAVDLRLLYKKPKFLRVFFQKIKNWFYISCKNKD